MPSAKLLSHFGNDLMVVNTARVSYGKESSQFEGKDKKLINYLVKHKHTSPFRHPQLQFRITVPIYVERQLFKHQVGLSANSISGRYVDFSDTYTEITEWRQQSKSSKQGSEGLVEKQRECTLIESKIITECRKAYQDLIDLGVSKEQARTILPMNLNTTFIWTGSFLAFIHLFNLRLKPDAQKETRAVVQLMLEELQQIDDFKYSLEAFGYGKEEVPSDYKVGDIVRVSGNKSGHNFSIGKLIELTMYLPETDENPSYWEAKLHNDPTEMEMKYYVLECDFEQT